MRSIEAVVLLLGNTDDPVSRILLDNAPRLGRPLIAIPFANLSSDVSFGPRWAWRGLPIDPARTAIVNRLPVASLGQDATASFFKQQQLWALLHAELARFAYTSSIPSEHSLIGGYGSLVDQWSDLPALVPGLRVPAYRAAPEAQRLTGEVYAIDPSRLYSLGTPVLSDRHAIRQGEIEYVRPRGGLMHVAQVGGTVLFANAPPHIATAQRDYVVWFTRSMAVSSKNRILEHAFFVDGELPVFFSTYPLPVLTAAHAAYADLLLDGLTDDIERHRQRIAA